jgi:formate dehydrogenase major subunit
MSVSFLIDGKPLVAQPDETIFQAASRSGIEIPHLCYKDGYRADGNCRACVVEIDGERVLAPSCCRAPKPGMVVQTQSPRARAAQAMVMELLLSDSSNAIYTSDSELSHWANKLGINQSQSRFASRSQPPADASHPAMSVNLDACIQCGRCVRACREEQGNDVIGYAWRGDQAKIIFDFDDPMGASSCVGCGECVQACPTGALASKAVLNAKGEAKLKAGSPELDVAKVDSLCPFCGVGCQVTYEVANNKIIAANGRDGPANHSRLCVKGRFGFDYAMSPERLTTPLIRKRSADSSVVKPKRFENVPSDWKNDFREASWDEALSLVASEFLRIKAVSGPKALVGFGSAKGSNEEAYLFQKLVRTGFGSNNVDHCTRLCHASSVAALMEGVGSAAVSNQVSDVAFADLIFVIGANPTVNHPVAATWIKNAVRNGAKLVMADPRRTELARKAWRVLQFKPDTDVALLNAMLHTIIFEGLADEKFINERTTDFEDLRVNVEHTTPEAMSAICGVAANEIREIARAFAKSKAAMIFWGMGVSQHIHGTDNARCLISLAMITGQIGRRGTGLHPLRGQNNVQGASDAGLIPMVFPDYQGLDLGAARLEKLWNLPKATLSVEPGLTVVEVMHAASRGDVKGMYVMGENPAMSDPDLTHARAALAKLEFLVVQDIFPTETAYLADVILPASALPEKTGTFTNTDRMVQLAKAAITPPGQAKQDLWIIHAIAKYLGVPWALDEVAPAQNTPAVVYEEMRQTMDSIAGITWDRLQVEGSITYPCERIEDGGQSVVFIDRFPTANGRAKLVPAKFHHADELPDAEFPLILITGRQLEHWHTGSMTRRATSLDAIEPNPTVSLNSATLVTLDAFAGDKLRVTSRRGSIELIARLDEGVATGNIFIPFAYAEAAANLLTNPALDPYGKIPEFKFCAVKIERLIVVD